ncbi:MAG: TfoX/Sxy family protein [Melioribacteraceae bacterium]|nr:TfoX/Sxy family protein [Melioribacteraceae bacterium]
MAHNELLEIRLRDLFSDVKGSSEKKMFGGIAFFINGNMSCGVHKDHLIVRVGPEKYEKALSDPVAKEFDITGRPMNGWIMIAASVLTPDEVFKKWVSLGLEFAESLPKKHK